MKTRNFYPGAIVVGILGASFAACSAQSSGTPPRPDNTGATGNTGNTGNPSSSGGTGNTGNTGNVGTGNTGNVGTNSGGSGNTGNVGTSLGGSGNTGNVGTGPGGASTSLGGTSTSGGGGTGTSVMSCGTLAPSATDPKCCIAVGAATDTAIDDLEDGDNVILKVGNRQGYWYTYSDSTATQMPKPASQGGGNFKPTSMGGNPCSLLPSPPACSPGTTGGTLFFAGTTGSLMPATSTVPTYAGVGFDLNNHFTKSCPYNGAAYKGISFWAKGTTAFQAAVKIPATTISTSDSGTCTTVGKCEDHFSKLIAPMPGGAWSKFTITFTGDTTFAQAGWGVAATFDPSNLLGAQFQVNGVTTATAAAPFDVAIDDVAFF